MQLIDGGAVLTIQPDVGSDDAAYARLLRADWQMRRIAAGLGSPVPKLVNTSSSGKPATSPHALPTLAFCA
jgi:hypothetical protein